LARRPGDLPERGDERLKNMERVVLKPQNLPKQLRLLVDSPPVQGRPCISDLLTTAYETDSLPWKILEAIQTNSAFQEITLAECMEEEGWVMYRGSMYVPDNDELRLRIIQEHHDIALAGHPGRAKSFHLHHRVDYLKEMQKDADQYIRNYHDCHQSQSLRH